MKKRILIALVVVLALAATASLVWATSVSLTVASDTSVMVYGPLDHYAPLGHSDWGTTPSPAVQAVDTYSVWPPIDSATWISTADYVEEPVNDSWRWFSTTFELCAGAYNIQPAVLSVTSDNAEEAYLNGVLVGSDGEVQVDYYDDAEWGTVMNYPITPQPGVNTLDFIVRNYACYSPDSSGSYFCGTPADPEMNPTGLIYKAVIDYECPTIEKTLVSGDDPIGIYLDHPTTYVFQIAYEGPAAKVIDTVPAEFDCVGEPVASDGTATCSKTGGGGTKGANRIEWDVPAGSNTLTITILTVESPGKGHKPSPVYKPTSCGLLPLNDGAVAYEVDEFGDLVLDAEGNPIVIVGPSNSLVVEAVEGAKPCEEG